MDPILIIRTDANDCAENRICAELKALLQNEEATVRLVEVSEVLQEIHMVRGTVVFVFPLNMGSVPSVMLALWQKLAVSHIDLCGYAVIHNGLLEAKKGLPAAEAFRCFCRRCNSTGGTFCIGTDWMTDQLAMRVQFSSRLKQFAKAVAKKEPIQLEVQALWSRDAFGEANRKAWEKRGKRVGRTKEQMDTLQIAPAP